MSDVSITLVGGDEVLKKFRALYDRAKNKEYAMKLVANAMQRDVKQHFEDEKSPTGKWKDLKPATWAWKTKHGKSWILRNSGDLWKGNLPEHDNETAKVVNRMEYAQPQNYGDSKRNLPAREFLWLSKAAMTNIIKLITAYIKGGM